MQNTSERVTPVTIAVAGRCVKWWRPAWLGNSIFKAPGAPPPAAEPKAFAIAYPAIPSPLPLPPFPSLPPLLIAPSPSRPLNPHSVSFSPVDSAVNTLRCSSVNSRLLVLLM